MSKRIFSPRLYARTLLRLKTVGIAMLIAVVGLNLFFPLSAMLSGVQYDSMAFADAYGGGMYDRPPTPTIFPVPTDEFASFLRLMVIFAPLVTYLAFSYLHDRGKSDFYHALPQTRVCVYLSVMAAVLTWTLGTVALSVAVNSLLWWIAPYHVFTAQTALVGNLALYSAWVFFLTGLMSVAVCLTGALVPTVLAFGWMTFFPPLALTFAQMILDDIAPILRNTSAFTTLLSPERFILFEYGGLAAGDADVGAILFYGALGLLAIAAGGLLYRFRRSETAGKSAPSNRMQHVFRTLFVMAPAVLTVALIHLEESASLTLFLLIGCVLTYLVYELMTTRKLSRMLRSIPLMILPVLLSVCYSAGIYGIKEYVYHVTPERDEIASITFPVSGGYGGWGDTALLGKPITDPALIGRAADDLARVIGGANVPNGIRTVVRFQLKSGYTFERYFTISQDIWDTFRTSEENIETYLRLPTWEEIDLIRIPPLGSSPYGNTKTDLERQVWECFAKEYAALSVSDRMRVMLHEWMPYVATNRQFSYYIDAQVYVDGMGEYRTASYVLTPELTPKTVALIEQAQYGGKEHIMGLLNLIQAENAENGEYKTTVVCAIPDLRCEIDTGTFFACVSLDEHLVSDTPGRVCVMFGESKYAFFLALTESEWQALGLPALKN